MVEVRKMKSHVPGELDAYVGMWYELQAEEWDGREPFPALGHQDGLRQILQLWSEDSSHYVAMAWQDEWPVGIVHGSIVLQPHLNPPFVLSINSVYVDPTVRKTQVARELIKSLRKWAESFNITTGRELLQYAQWMAVPTDKQMKRYIRKGATPFGVLFAKRMEDSKL